MTKLEKPIHIVFQVLNFLHSELSVQYDLLPNDKLILINLASHHGPKGICPSTALIAKELYIAKRYLLTRLDHLEDKKLIKIKKQWGKRNSYELLFLESTSDPRITSDLQLTGDPQITTLVIPRSPVLVIPRSPNQLSKQLNNNRERKRASRSTLSLDNFLPNDKAKALAQEMNIDVIKAQRKFVAYVRREKKSYPDIDAAFELWILNERVTETVSSEIPKQNITPVTSNKCSICDNDKFQCRCRVTPKEEGVKKIREIMKTNGLMKNMVNKM